MWNIIWISQGRNMTLRSWIHIWEQSPEAVLTVKWIRLFSTILTSSSQTDSKYLSMVSTKLWMNSSTANSFWKKNRVMVASLKNFTKQSTNKHQQPHRFACKECVGLSFCSVLLIRDMFHRSHLPLHHHRQLRQKIATHIYDRWSLVLYVLKKSTETLPVTDIVWLFLPLRQHVH